MTQQLISAIGVFIDNFGPRLKPNPKTSSFTPSTRLTLAPVSKLKPTPTPTGPALASALAIVALAPAPMLRGPSS